MSTRVRASTPSSSRRKVTKKKPSKKRASKKKTTKKKATNKKTTKKKAAKKKVAKVANTKKKTTKSAPKKGKKDKVAPKPKKAEKLTSVAAARCKSCHDIIYSRTDDDVRQCRCGRASIEGGPEAGRIHGGGIRLHYPIKVTRTQLARDKKSWNNQYGYIRFPARGFEYLSYILPMHFGRFRLDFVEPRSTPERAPERRAGSGSIWVDGVSVWGKVRLSVRGDSPKSVASLVPLGTVDMMRGYGVGSAISYWRNVMPSLLMECCIQNPQWASNLPHPKDLIHLDVISHKDPSEARIRRALKTKGRLGKFL